MIENSRVSLRFATPADTDLILEYIKGLAEYEKLAHEVVADEDGLRNTLFGDRPAAEVVLADMDGNPAGFAIFFHSFSTLLGRQGLYLEDLYIKPELRGHGIGKALLSRLAAIAVERGCGRFEWSVLDWNESAIRFYENLGAKAMEGWTVFRVTGEALLSLADED